MQLPYSPGPYSHALIQKAQKDFTRQPVKQETLVQSLGREDPLEEGMALHSSILAWRILWTEEPDGTIVCGIPKSQT